MPRIDIMREPDGTITFDPLVLKGSSVGDRIFWRNLDQQEDHWITRKGQPQDFWFRYPVARFVPGDPPDTSHEIVLQHETPITYVSFTHPNDEGQIVFSTNLVASVLSPRRMTPASGARGRRK
jgi:hypothetical protein